MLDKNQVQEIINDFVDPATEIKLGETKPGIKVEQEGDKQVVTVTLGYPVKGYATELQQQLADKLNAAVADGVSVKVDTKVIKHKVQQGVPALENVKNIIAVASGKGGVGKSTTAVNLALQSKFMLFIEAFTG